MDTAASNVPPYLELIVMAPRKPQRFSDDLRLAIADTLHSVPSYDLPAKCLQLGLATGTPEEAFSSKRGYVKARIKEFSETALLDLARGVLQEFDAPELQDLVSERRLPTEHRISELTRREILKVLDGLDELFGDLGRFDIETHLAVLSPPWTRTTFFGTRLRTLSEDVQRHYLRNHDWSHFELLEHCGALSCTQQRFVQFLEDLLRPVLRRGADQVDLANALDALLKADGYAVRVAEYQSGHPTYRVVRRNEGVDGSPKNLIFASLGAKPEIVFRDAVNNDVEITKNANLCLIYDQPLSGAAGLPWKAMAEWWQSKHGEFDLAGARRSLGKRLLHSVELSGSPGEYAIFKAYFEEFSPRLGDRLPALIPQVYLHYDPMTIAQRGDNPVLPRQRMDFLMLLEGNVRVVIEVDGQHHYAVDGKASPRQYAQMIIEDRRLRLRGYELYRFGGYEFSDSTNTESKRQVGPTSHQTVKRFFEELLARHGLLTLSRH